MQPGAGVVVKNAASCIPLGCVVGFPDGKVVQECGMAILALTAAAQLTSKSVSGRCQNTLRDLSLV